MQHVRFIRRTAIMGVVSLLVSARGMLLLPVLTRTLGKVQFGIFSQFIILLQLLIPFATLGLENAVLRYLAGKQAKERLAEGFYSCLVVNCATAAVLWALAWLAESWIFLGLFGGDVSRGQVHTLIIWLLPLLLLHALAILITSYLRTIENFVGFTSLSLIDSFLYLLLAIYWAVGGYGVSGVIWALVIGKGVVVGIGFGIAMRSIGLPTLPRFALLPSFLRFSLPILPGLFFYYSIQFSDRYVLGIFRSLEEIAKYNAAYTFGGIFSLIFAPFFQLVNPRVNALWNEGRVEEVGLYLSKAIKYALAMAIPALCVIGLFAVQLMQLYATRAFAVSREILIMIMLAYILIMLRAFGRIVIMLQERIHLILWVDGVSVVGNLVLNLALIPTWGIAGAALATLLTFAVQFVVYGLLTKEYIPYKMNIQFSIKAFFAAGIMGMVVFFGGLHGPFTGSLVLGTGLFIYGTLLWLLRGFSREELATFHSAFLAPVLRRLPGISRGH